MRRSDADLPADSGTLVAKWPIAAAMAVLALLSLTSRGRCESPFEFCRQAGTDDTLRSIPASLVPDLVRLFDQQAMPAPAVQRLAYYRCANHRVLVCSVGANLPCGKADTRQRIPEVDTWCAGHQGSDVIPLYVTGHATIYRWHCDGAQAKASETALGVDEQGFVAQYWKEAGPD